MTLPLPVLVGIDPRTLIYVVCTVLLGYMLYSLARLARLNAATACKARYAARVAPVVAAVPEAPVAATQLREDFAALRTVVLELKDEVAFQKGGESAFPQYTEAMTMAQCGVEPLDLADRCGISVQEAELVQALINSQAKADASADEALPVQDWRHRIGHGLSLPVGH